MVKKSEKVTTPLANQKRADDCQGERKAVTSKLYHAEEPIDQVADEGDLDEETLDADAPYNKSYGLEKPSSTD